MITVSLESRFKPILEDIIIKESVREKESNIIEVTECLSCLRQAYFTRKEGIGKINKVIIEGRAIHNYIESLLNKYYPNIVTEQEYIVDFGEEIKIMMKPDVVLDDRVVDIKTTDRDTVFLPDIKYELQTNFYAVVLMKEYYEIVYITRRGSLHAFVSPISYDMFYEVINRARKLYLHLKNDTIPDREPQNCYYCPFYHKCFRQKKLL